MKRIVGGMNNPWNAFQSAFTEQPFDTYAMTKCQVAMFYHTMKDHLVRHADPLTSRPTSSLWDYVPEPRLQEAQEEKEQEEEEEILQREADDARSQWVDQMTNLSKIAMPFSRRITIYVVALVSVALAVESFWSPAAADSLLPLLQ